MKIPNATPLSYNLGFRDDSRRQLSPQPLSLPSHRPKVFGFYRKGKVGKNHLVVGDSRSMIYGVESFDPQSPYYNHATVFANIFNKNGNAVLMERVLPDDAAPPAAMRLSLDLLETQVQDYERNIDGTYKIDVQGNKIPTASKIPGLIGKWVIEPIGLDVDGARLFGQGTIKAGDQTDQTTSTQSQRYPWFDFMVSSEGEWGNNVGLSIWANTLATAQEVDTRLIDDQKVYPFQIAVRSRPDVLTSATVERTVSGSESIPFVLKPGLIDKNTKARVYLGDTFVKSYQDIENPAISPTYASFDRLKVYDTNIAVVLQKLYDAEKSHADAFSDITGDDNDEIYRLNPFSAISSKNSPYHSFQLVLGAPNSVRLSQNATHFALGGSDGTMTDAVFDSLVRQKLIEYGDKNSPRQDAVNNPENIFWDSGFSVETKMAMANMIAVRKGIFVQASTHVVGGPSLSDEQERSLAISLLAAFQNYPESAEYATAATRASIFGGSGFLIDSLFDKSVPISIDRADSWSRYMGASNGKWVSSQKPDVRPNNQVTLLRDLNVTFRSIAARYKDWDAGLVWADPYTMGTSYFPQHQTIYPDDTSVLNNAINAFAATTLWAVGELAHRNNTGRTDKTKDQLAQEINNDILEAVEGVYDNRFIIIPETTYSADDDLRGYSWTTVIKIGMNVSKTVQTLTVNTYRYEDLQQ